MDEVQGRSVVNTIDYDLLESISEIAESRLERLSINKNLRKGCEFQFIHTGPSANYYKYGQGATEIYIVRKTAGWNLSNIERTKVYPKSKQISDAILTKVAYDKAVRNFKSKLFVKPESTISKPMLDSETEATC